MRITAWASLSFCMPCPSVTTPFVPGDIRKSEPRVWMVTGLTLYQAATVFDVKFGAHITSSLDDTSFRCEHS